MDKAGEEGKTAMVSTKRGLVSVSASRECWVWASRTAQAQRESNSIGMGATVGPASTSRASHEAYSLLRHTRGTGKLSTWANDFVVSTKSYCSDVLAECDADAYKAAGMLPVCISQEQQSNSCMLHCMLVQQNTWKVKREEHAWHRMYSKGCMAGPSPDELARRSVTTLTLCGGKRKREDASAVNTALREADEETYGALQTIICSPAERIEAVHFFAPGKFALFVLEVEEEEMLRLQQQNEHAKQKMHQPHSDETTGVISLPLRPLLDGQLKKWRIGNFARYLLTDKPLVQHLVQKLV